MIFFVAYGQKDEILAPQSKSNYILVRELGDVDVFKFN